MCPSSSAINSLIPTPLESAIEICSWSCEISSFFFVFEICTAVNFLFGFFLVAFDADALFVVAGGAGVFVAFVDVFHFSIAAGGVRNKGITGVSILSKPIQNNQLPYQ